MDCLQQNRGGINPPQGQCDPAAIQRQCHQNERDILYNAENYKLCGWEGSEKKAMDSSIQKDSYPSIK